jgi:hypothetical protein
MQMQTYDIYIHGVVLELSSYSGANDKVRWSNVRVTSVTWDLHVKYDISIPIRLPLSEKSRSADQGTCNPKSALESDWQQLH